MNKTFLSLVRLFNNLPENYIKKSIRDFIAFNAFVPKSISKFSPLKCYESCYNLKKGEVVIDAGAYSGDYTIFAAKKVGPKGKVIVFEPDFRMIKPIKNFCLKERLSNIIIIPKGLWSKNTALEFKLKNNGSSGVKSVEQFYDSIAEPLTEDIILVPFVKLDDELKKLDIKRVDVIKMDIEGSEIEAIKGSINTLRNNNINLLIASYHIVDGKKTYLYLEKFLSNIGYRTKTSGGHLTTHGFKL